MRDDHEYMFDAVAPQLYILVLDGDSHMAHVFDHLLVKAHDQRDGICPTSRRFSIRLPNIHGCVPFYEPVAAVVVPFPEVGVLFVLVLVAVGVPLAVIEPKAALISAKVNGYCSRDALTASKTAVSCTC